MADGINNLSSGQIGSNYDKYKDMFAKEANDALGQKDFLRLLTEQLKNQDFNNPMDNTEFIAQMAQFSQLQAIQQMTYYSRASYATSLVGKNVAVAGFDARGNFTSDEGIVTAVRMEDEDFIFTVNGNEYTSQNIMEVKAWTVPDVGGGDNETPDDETEPPETEEPEAPEGTEPGEGKNKTYVVNEKGELVEKEPTTEEKISDLLDELLGE